MYEIVLAEADFCSASPLKFSSTPWLYLTNLITPYTAREKEGLKRTYNFQHFGSGYFYEQATKPQTIGYGLADSPVELLAWMYEKLVTWTDSYPWTDDEGEPTPLLYRRRWCYITSFGK